MGDRRRWSPEPDRSSREIPSEMLQEILMKLPAKDVARSCCVSRQWRGVAGDPSFRSLHAASYVAPWADAQVLLVAQTSEPDEASVYSMSSGKPMAMCSVAIPSDYRLANVCNGLLCFVHRYEAAQPAVVCNPVTGETLALPRAPPLPTDCIFALGFSPPRREYKLFRLSPPFVDVYTLGDAGGWRQRTDLSLPRPDEIMDWPPQLIDGKLYVLTIDDRVLVVDVSTETCRTYHYPEHEAVDNVIHPPRVRRPFAMHPFELDGQPCFAVHATGGLRGVHFWVMSPPVEDGKQPQWDLRHSFEINRLASHFGPSSAWVDDGEMLCYMLGGTLYMYGMKAHPPPTSNHGRWLEWDQRISLKEIPLWREPSADVIVDQS
ncbi:F-box protein At5g65850-like [Aegilops tauschii subsp. strangulata]|uniref:F-box protein At5g65850-like n=1 Tax=Aegilops tauschii subsp. strangulata TaxID=200361 RepID=UPI00098A0890|nr:F-box protein At5g65850-like [Aegilops tauschii subsp. strangulata]